MIGDIAIYVGVFTLGVLFGMVLVALFGVDELERRTSKYAPPQSYED